MKKKQETKSMDASSKYKPQLNVDRKYQHNNELQQYLFGLYLTIDK